MKQRLGQAVRPRAGCGDVSIAFAEAGATPHVRAFVLDRVQIVDLELPHTLGRLSVEHVQGIDGLRRPVEGGIAGVVVHRCV